LVTIKTGGEIGKTLIIGQTFDKYSGGGITMSNLFYGIDPENIAVLTTPKQAPKTNKEMCRSVYQLGREELKVIFPVSLLYPKYESGPINIRNQGAEQQNRKANNKKAILISWFTTLAHFLGVYHFIYKLELSEKLRKWIKEFDPDFIYSQLSTRELINFVGSIKQEIKKPLIVHIMDDWHLTINKTGIFKKKWDKIIDKEYKYLLNISDERLCISEAMSGEYNKRYGGSWKYFHNPIMIERWIPFQKKTYCAGTVFRILYSGRIGNSNINSIITLCNIVNELRGKGILIELHIYSPDFDIYKFRKYTESSGIRMNEPVDHKAIPELFSRFDLLYLPIDFDKHSVKFTRFSMPTKMSEYMISGVPVLVHAPGETAVVKFAKQHDIAFISDNNDNESLSGVLLDLIKNEEARKKVALRAIEVAQNKFDGINVRKNFQSIFNK
jgi:glycosyltransferase involved in cell wall biosynthesis